MAEILQISNLNKSYKHDIVLNNISLQLQEGKIYGLIGTNGAGKTTLIKAILGFIKYTGKISISDRVSALSYVPEIIKFYDYLTGLQAVKLITSLQGQDIDQVIKNFHEKAQKIDYFDHNKLIKQHSKGNLRKLMLLQAFSVNTDLIILDEPFSGLDPLVTTKLNYLFEEKKQTGATILLSTHLFEMAKKICDVLIFIKNGNILDVINKEKYENIKLIDIFHK